MRKILTQKFWSLGTSLGSMGSLSQKGPPEIFSNVVFLHPWGPNKAPSNAFEPLLVEKLKMFPARCDRVNAKKPHFFSTFPDGGPGVLG